jgi:hypothetical protein
MLVIRAASFMAPVIGLSITISKPRKRSYFLSVTKLTPPPITFQTIASATISSIARIVRP